LKNLLTEEKVGFLSNPNKDFIKAFDEAMENLGFGSGEKISDGYCWGKYLISYSKTGTKTQRVVSRIYIRENSIVLRLFLNKIDDHRRFIEESPDFIREAFNGNYGRCKHCKNQKSGLCRFRKTYTLMDEVIERCNGFTFEFPEPTTEKLPEYMRLFSEFYPQKRHR
jgi:hypothetical protein